MAEPMEKTIQRSRIVIVTGKGGCGKTTVASSIAVGAAERGLEVALVEMGKDEHIHKLLDPDSAPVGYLGQYLMPRLWVSHINPFEALAEYLSLQIGMRALVRRSLRQRAFQQLLSAAPGWRELITLGKIWHLERQRLPDGRPRHDLIVVDAPATGHGLTFLDVPRVVQSAIRSGPLSRRAADVEALICDPERTKLLPVCLAEELPVRETAELVTRVREDLHLTLERVVVNGVVERPFSTELEDGVRRLAKLPADLKIGKLPTAAEMARCCDGQLARYEMNRHYIEEVARVTNLPVLCLPKLSRGIRDPGDLLRLSREFFRDRLDRETSDPASKEPDS